MTAPTTKAEELTGSLSANGPARSTVTGAPLSADELDKIDAYWRACNYLALGMIYLQANPPFARITEARTYQESAARSLGLEPRACLHLYPSESSYPKA